VLASKCADCRSHLPSSDADKLGLTSPGHSSNYQTSTSSQHHLHNLQYVQEKINSFSIGEAANSGFNNIQLARVSQPDIHFRKGMHILQEMRQTGLPELQELRSESANGALSRQVGNHCFGVRECCDQVCSQLIEFRISGSILAIKDLVASRGWQDIWNSPFTDDQIATFESFDGHMPNDICSDTRRPRHEHMFVNRC